MTLKQVSVFLENKPGTLAELTELLAEKKINLRALSVAEAPDFGIVRLITAEPEQAVERLHDAGCICRLSPVLAVGVDDTPGALSRTLRVLDGAGCAVEYAYASLSPQAGRAFLILGVKDCERAEAALKAAGVADAIDGLY